MTTETAATTTTAAPAAEAAAAAVAVTTPAATTEAPKTDAAAPAAATTEAPKTEPTDAEKAAASAAEDAKKPEDKKTDDGKKPAGAPEGDYAAFDLGEGVSLNPEVMTNFTTLAKKHNLSQEAAAEFAALGANIGRGFGPMQEKILADADAKWQKDSRADAEFGGTKYDENLSTAKKALDTFGTPELVKFLDESKLGNHPEVIRYFYKVGSRIGEDKMFTGDAPNPATKSASDVLYGATSKKTA